MQLQLVLVHTIHCITYSCRLPYEQCILYSIQLQFTMCTLYTVLHTAALYTVLHAAAVYHMNTVHCTE